MKEREWRDTSLDMEPPALVTAQIVRRRGAKSKGKGKREKGKGTRDKGQGTRESER
jgi:hypothetical protein